MPQEYTNGQFTVSTDPSRLDVESIYAFLSAESYWARGRPREVVARSLEHSLCFGVYHGSRQIGLARVVSDYAVFAHLADVYILSDYRGQGLGKWLISCILAHPDLQGISRFQLGTRDAHGLYRQFGFKPFDHPEWHMELIREPAKSSSAGEAT